MASRELNILIRAKNLAGNAIAGVKKELGGIGKDVRRGLGNAAHNVERGIMIAGAAAVGGLTLAIKTAADFEDAFAGVVKTVDEVELAAAGLTFDELRDSFRAMAREMPIAFEELAAIGEAAGALGIAAGDIDSFTEVVAKLGVTTDLTSDQAATAMGHLGTILDLTGEQFEEVADALVALGNDGASTESQIVAVAERFAASGSAAGLAKEDILALASTATSMGVEVEAAGSSLSRLFDGVATNIGTSNKKAKAFAEALELSAADFRKAWEKDALGTFQDFLAVLAELDQFEAAALLKDIGVTGVRDVRAMRLLATGAEELSDQLETARSAAGALNEEAEKKFATTASKWTKFQNIVKDVGFVIGSELLPVVNELLTDFAEFMALPETQKQIKKFAQDLAAGVRDAVTWARSLDWEAIGNSLKTAAGFAKGLVEAFLGLPSWVQAAVVTGWGLNKLTGGALGSIVGSLASGLIKGILGINAGVVNVNAATVNGVPGAGAGGLLGGKGGLLGTLLKGGLAIGGGAVIGAHIGTAINEGTVSGARDFAQGQVKAVLASGDAAQIERAIQVIEKQLNPEDSKENAAQMTALLLDINGVRTTLEDQKATLEAQLDSMGVSRDQAAEQLTRMNALKDSIGIAKDAQVAEIRAMKADVSGNLTTLRSTTLAASQHSTQKLSDVKAETAALHGTLRAKDFSPNVSVTSHTSVVANISVSATQIAQSLRITQAASQTSFTGRGGESRF